MDKHAKKKKASTLSPDRERSDNKAKSRETLGALGDGGSHVLGGRSGSGSGSPKPGREGKKP